MATIKNHENLIGLRGTFRTIIRFIANVYSAIASFLYRRLPKKLFARSLIILLGPMILLQTVVVLVFEERHLDLVTKRLSESVTRSISAFIELHEKYQTEESREELKELAQRNFELELNYLPNEPFPEAPPKPFFDTLDQYLTLSIQNQINKPFWLDTVSDVRRVEIRIQLNDRVLQVFARKSLTFASNYHIFFVWMFCTAIVLITISIIFLRNQIRPIQKLASAAEGFGKGRPVEGFKPSGSSEVRQASIAFIQMRQRIERHISQRTAMLSGVSHDLRTVLTRLKLQIALIQKQGIDVEALERDIATMTHMLEAYLDFAKGAGDEEATNIEIPLLFEELETDAEVLGKSISSTFQGDPNATVKPNAFKRCLSNLIGNACRYANKIEMQGRHADNWLTVTIQDDGPSIPEEEREAAFRPFYRIDTARNQNESSTGLGLSIARDIARGHGGEISLEDSQKLGGLLVQVRIPA